MGTPGSASAQEARRRLAVARVNEGWLQKDIAAFLDASTRAVGKWIAAYRVSGEEGLKARPRPGPKPRLSKRREQGVLSWMAGSPRAFGCQDDLWTTRRLAEVIEKKYKVRFNSNYLAEWLTNRGYTPRKPEVRAVERDEPAITRWVAVDWPGIQKSEGRAGAPRPDRRERLLHQLPGAPDLVPQGRTPLPTGFGRHRDMVSTIVAITVAPRRRRLGLYLRTDTSTRRAWSDSRATCCRGCGAA